MPRIQLFYVNAGGGHRAAAESLAAVLRSASPPSGQAPAAVELCDLQEILRPADLFHRYLHLDTQGIYNQLLARGWTWGMGAMVPILQALIRWRQPQLVRYLAEFFQSHPPDLVVVLMPHFNCCIAQALARAAPQARWAVVLTDLADTPAAPPPGRAAPRDYACHAPRSRRTATFWLAGPPPWVACGSPHAVGQARAAGLPETRILSASGMILSPRFYDLPPLDRAAERRRHHLDPGLPLALVFFGGQGSRAMPEIARHLARAPQPWQAVFICGYNEPVAARLRQMCLPYPHCVLGFTREIPYWMRLADVLFGKPGPGVLQEATHLGLPAVVTVNSATMPQERFNGDWLQEQGSGLVLRSWRQLPDLWPRLTLSHLERMRQCARSVSNQAVFEVAAWLRRLLPAADE